MAILSGSDKPTVIVSGGFDPAHIGHYKLFEHASEYGDVVILLNTDEWLSRKKGKPFMSWKERAHILLKCRDVSGVMMAQDDDGTVCKSLKEIIPDYFANGGDRKADNTPEVKLCEKLGIKLLWNIGGEKCQSSSELVKNAVG